MKVLAINGSPRKNGNTALAIETVVKELEKEGIKTETLHVERKSFKGCISCGKCHESKELRCIFDDGANEWIKKMVDADGIILGSPVYYSGVNGTLKAFLDRAFFVSSAAGARMRLKVGAAVVAVRRSGATATLDQLHKYFTISEMLLPTSSYWNAIHGMAEGEAREDEEGMLTMRVLGRNMAWLLKVIEYSKGHIPLPAQEEKIFTNFIR